jgi:hypothetical protein
MNDIKLEVEVHGYWNNEPPVYRIFVDQELFTERTFGWPSFKAFLREHIFCTLEDGLHTLRLENYDTNSRFDLQNFKLNNKPIGSNFYNIYDNIYEWSFIVRSETLG